ncbi:M23 family metallopeptidase [Patescibacteria group bacterium]
MKITTLWGCLLFLVGAAGCKDLPVPQVIHVTEEIVDCEYADDTASGGSDTAAADDCAAADDTESDDAAFDAAAESDEPISSEEAYDIAVKAGVDPDFLVYSDVLPYIISETEAEMTWGFIEQYGDDYFVTYVDQWDGEVLEAGVAVPDNIQAFVDEAGLDLNVMWGSTPNTYNSFPWHWRLPMERGSFYLTCGYGCYAHTGRIYYSTDWANGSSGHLLESPASCWVLYTTYSSSYGHQVVAECGNAGSGRRYYYRVGHMRRSAMVTPGWWIGKGRDIGYIGNSGSSTGPHVHYEAVRARGFSSGSFSSHEDLPINRWPSRSDSICDGDFSGYNFSGTPDHYITVRSDGCP